MNKKNNNNKISTYIVNKTEENKNDNKKQMQIIPDFNNPYLNDFNNVATWPGNGWYEKRGTPTEIGDYTWNGGPSSNWSNWTSFPNKHTGNNTRACKINIYKFNYTNDWLISPVFNLNVGPFVVSCDAAATEYADTTNAVWGNGDKVVLFMTSDGQPDGGFQPDSLWIELERWDGSNNPGTGDSTGDIPISGYSNIDYTNVQFAFYAEQGGTWSDFDFFIDNFKVKFAADGICDEDDGTTGTVNYNSNLAILTQPNNGVASISISSGVGVWTYTPDANFNGLDSFTITIDGSTVYKELEVLVRPINDAATIQGDTSGIYRGLPVTGQLSVTDNVDGFTNGTFSITEPTYGNASIEADGSWTYTPNANFMDTDTFTVLLTDDDNHIEGQTITIIGALSGDNTGVGDEDSSITGQITINSAYTATHSITSSTPFSVTEPTNGNASIDDQGNWSYTPSVHFYGTDTFTVYLTEDDNIQARTITITVNPIDDLPTITGDISVLYSGTPSVTGQIIVTDVEGFNNDNRFSTNYFQTTFSDGAKPDGWVTEQSSGDGWRFTGVPYSYDGTNYAGASGTYAWVDFSDTDSGVILRNTDTLLPVGNLNIQFDFFSYAYESKADDLHNILYVEIGDPNSPFPWTILETLQRNTYNPENDTRWETITITHYNTEPNLYFRFRAESGGDAYDYRQDLLISDVTVGPNTAATAASIDNDGNWTYTPNQDFIGTDTFTVIITDDLGKKTLQDITIYSLVTGTSDLSGVGDEDSSITGQITINPQISSSYTNNNIFSLTTNPSNGTATINSTTGVWDYTPNDHFHGTDTFTVTLTKNDNTKEDINITITVNPVNDTPTITGDISGVYIDQPVTGQLAVTDPDGFTNGTFAVFAVTTNGSATIQADGSWTYTPNANFDTTDTFTVLITDDLGSETLQDITITKLISVKPYIISSNKANSIMEHSGPNQIIYKAFANDPDNASSNLTYFMEYTDKFTINKYTGEVRLIPNPIYAVKSEYTFNVYAKDPDGNTGYYKTVTLKILPAYITLKQPDKNELPIDDIIIQAKKGWKLIGTTTESILLKNNLIVSNSIYMFKDGYETIAYSEEDKGYPLKANKGIWIKLDW